MEASYSDFFTNNLLLIGLLGLAIFTYLVLLIRKRKRQEFLHREEEKKQS